MSLLKSKIFDLCTKELPRVIAVRRDLHQHPELGFEVHRTAGVVVDQLKDLGLKVRTGVGKTGIVADLQIPGATKRILLRADMDALPIQEEGDKPYKSKTNGVAHMCGHDAHTAILIGAARVLSQLKDQLKVNVRFMFQPNEEGVPSGAQGMIAEGVLEGVDEAYALHVDNHYEKGQIATAPEAIFAQGDIFEITITGKGGHAALPEKSIDPIVVAAQFVTLSQSLVSRRLSPLESGVFSITKFQAGTTHNVIPPEAKLLGTVRALSTETKKQLRKGLEDILKGVTLAAGASYELKYTDGDPVTLNNSLCVEKMLSIGRNLLGQENVIFPVKPSLGSEDFGYLADKVPSCYFLLGTRQKDHPVIDLHNPQFDIDEQALLYGMMMHVGNCVGQGV